MTLTAESLRHTSEPVTIQFDTVPVGVVDTDTVANSVVEGHGLRDADGI
jgi:hypothetical protein